MTCTNKRATSCYAHLCDDRWHRCVTRTRNVTVNRKKWILHYIVFMYNYNHLRFFNKTFCHTVAGNYLRYRAKRKEFIQSASSGGNNGNAGQVQPQGHVKDTGLEQSQRVRAVYSRVHLFNYVYTSNFDIVFPVLQLIIMTVNGCITSISFRHFFSESVV